MGLSYTKLCRDTEMRMDLWGGDFGRQFRMLENNMVRGIRKKAWRVQSRWN